MKNLYHQKTFLIIKNVKLVGKEEFAIAALNLKHETFIVYMILLINSNLKKTFKIILINMFALAIITMVALMFLAILKKVDQLDSNRAFF